MSKSNKIGRLLIAAPSLPLAKNGRGCGPMHRLLRELAADWELRLVAAAPSEVETHYLRSLGGDIPLRSADEGSGWVPRCRAVLDAEDMTAVLVVDHERTRAGMRDLAGLVRKPLVIVRLGEGAVRGKPIAGPTTEFSARPRERQMGVSQTCVAAETWSFEAQCVETVDEGAAFLRRRSIDRAWMSRRLRRLAAGGAAPGRLALTSIIVPCRDGLRYTRECLASVARNTQSPYELIVVDNGSSDGTPAFVRKTAHARLLRNDSNQGFGRAINQGMRAAKGRYVVWLNNDVVVTSGWLEQLISCAERAPWIGAVGPMTNVTVGEQKVDPVPYRDTGAGLRLFAEAWRLRNRGQAVGLHRLTGFCLLLKREAMERTGFLDERFGLGCYEEFDYCLRLRQAGYDLACAREIGRAHV
jgi:hypothetical protein